jgi:hypothetical protein
MSDSEKAIRQAVARYRGVASINLMKSISVIIVGVLMIYLLASDKLFDSNSQDAPLYKTLGPDGVNLVVLAFGFYWTYSLIRKLRHGVKAYETELRKNMENNSR